MLTFRNTQKVASNLKKPRLHLRRGTGGGSSRSRREVVHGDNQNVRLVAGRTSRWDEVVQALGFWRVST